MKTACKLKHVPHAVSGLLGMSVRSVVVGFVKFALNLKHGFAQAVIKVSTRRLRR